MTNLSKHPNGLKLLFVTELAERFSYYGMRAILVLYLIAAFLGNASASRLYGSFAGLIYLSPILGGYIADRYWGNRRSIIVGAVIMIMGQLLLFASACLVKQSIFLDPVSGGTIDPSVDNVLSFWLMILGLACLIIGNGAFKPNISTMVGDLYERDDSRTDSAFTIFYMGVNIGAFTAPLLMGWLTADGGWTNPGVFRWGFLCAAIAMAVSLSAFLYYKDLLLVRPDGSPIGVVPEKPSKREAASAPKRQIWQISLCSLLAIGLFFLFSHSAADVNDYVAAAIYTAGIALPVFVICDSSLTSLERKKIVVVYVLAAFSVFFWAAYEQAGSSLTIFADQQCNRQLGSFTVPTTWFQSVNPIVVILFAPLLAMLWEWLGKRNVEPSSPAKQAIGLLLLAVGYMVIAIGTNGASIANKASMWWLVILFFITSIAELSVGPIGLSLVNKLSPARFASLMMGLWYTAFAASNALAGELATLLPGSEGQTQSLLGFPIESLTDFFMVFAVMAGGMGILLLCLCPWLKRLMK